MARAKKSDQDGPVVIKKYANRRLYNTQSSAYITLDDLARMTREDIDFTVLDAKSGEDITHNVLTQIIVEEENGERSILPVNFLRQLISMYGNGMQALMPSYLEASMENFRRNQKQFQDAVEGALSKNPIGQMALRNQRQFQEAVEKALKASPLGNVMEKALAPLRRDDADADADEETEAPDAAERQEKDAEILALKEQLADIQSKLDRLDN